MYGKNFNFYSLIARMTRQLKIPNLTITIDYILYAVLPETHMYVFL